MTSYSNPFVVDKTTPYVGSIYVGNFIGHRYYVSAADVKVYITDVRDIESGIRDVQMGIGSHPYTADVVSMQTYSGNYAEIENNGQFLDGHLYYAVVMVRYLRHIFLDCELYRYGQSVVIYISVFSCNYLLRHITRFSSKL